MARNVSLLIEPRIGCKIYSYVKDAEPVITPLFVDDKVNNFKFIKDGEVKVINGKISNINVVFKNASNSNDNSSTLDKDAKVSSITIDSSRIQNSIINTVRAKDILEYGTEEDCDKVKVTPYVEIDVTVTLTDDTVSDGTFKIGTKFSELTIMNNEGEEESLLGELSAFVYSYNTKTVNKSKDMEFVGFVVKDETGKTTRVNFRAVKTFSIDREDGE
jgi:hypothetical protein